MNRRAYLILTAGILLLCSCKKEKKDPYPKTIRFESTCDSCQVAYTVNVGQTYVNVTGDWSYTRDIAGSMFLMIVQTNLDSTSAVGSRSVRIFVDGELRASNTDGVGNNGLVSTSCSSD